MDSDQKLIELIKWLQGEKYLIDNHSTTMTEEFLKEHSEMADEVEEFKQWIAEEELEADFEKWLDKRGCLDMFEYCI